MDADGATIHTEVCVATRTRLGKDRAQNTGKESGLAVFKGVTGGAAKQSVIVKDKDPEASEG